MASTTSNEPAEAAEFVLNPEIVPTGVNDLGTHLVTDEGLRAGDVALTLKPDVELTGRGLFGPAYERPYVKALQAFAAERPYQALEQLAMSANADTDDEVVSEELLLGMLLAHQGAHARARPVLEAVVGADFDYASGPDRLSREYPLTSNLLVGLGDGWGLSSHSSSPAVAALALAGCYVKAELHGGVLVLLSALYMTTPDHGLLAALARLLSKDADGAEAMRMVFDTGWHSARARGYEAGDRERVDDFPPPSWKELLDPLAELKRTALRAQHSLLTLRHSIQRHGRIEAERLSHLQVACDFLAEAEAWSTVLGLGGEIEPTGETTSRIALACGEALWRQFELEAAVHVFSEVLRERKPEEYDTPVSRETVRFARCRRAEVNIALGRHSAARKDLAVTRAENPGDPATVELWRQVCDAPGQRPRRETIPRETKDRVWRRDEGRCVECGSQRSLEYDHSLRCAVRRGCGGVVAPDERQGENRRNRRTRVHVWCYPRGSETTRTTRPSASRQIIRFGYASNAGRGTVNATTLSWTSTVRRDARR